MTYRIGIDIGGTFTDLVLLEESTGRLASVKVPSTPRDPSIAFGRALQQAAAQFGIDLGDVAFVFHGTTVATNALLQRRLARTGLVTTEGFRDVLEIGRHHRQDMYNLFLEKPPPLVPRWWRLEVPERTDHRGEILQPLDVEAARQVARALKAAGVESVAVVFLHSYANPTNEQRMRAILAEEFPETTVTISAEVCREIREYERTSTTVVNATLLPLVGSYVGRLETALDTAGARCPIFLMQSNGGAMTTDAAKSRPVNLILSGPAAGVNACRAIGRAIGRDSLLGFDMGGTSTDVSVIDRGEPTVTTLGVVEQYPIKVPMIEIHTIGAGGGSIAWLDAGGALRVGPQSAGADPGPAAYGLGGAEPTVTDANLVLGRLNPDYLLGGALRVDVTASRRVIQEKIADPLGLDVVEAADGIIRIANANMERAIRVSSVEKGYDPRDFALVAFGGAGPVHAARLAQSLQIPLVVVPDVPGAFSALGLLFADIRHDFVQTQIQPAASADPAAVTAIFAALARAGLDRLEQDGIAPADRLIQRSVDMRYVGQAYEVTVPVPDGPLDATALAAVVAAFHREHERLFAHSSPAEPTEFVNFRISAIGRIKQPGFRKRAPGDRSPAAAQIGERAVYFAECGGFTPCPIYDRSRLTPRNELIGPAIVEQMDTTIVIYPGQRATVDSFGNILIETAPQSA